jgi:heat shock protein HtpX
MKDQLKSLLLLGILGAVLVGIGALISREAMWLFTLLAFAMNIGAYFFSDRIVLMMHRAREVSPAQAPGLHAMVAELAQRAGIPKPRVFMVNELQPNAFATGRNPKKGVVAVTTGIVRMLDERELRGVLAHEIGHIKNRDILVATIAATLAGAITWIANALSFGALFGGAGHHDDDDGMSPIGALAVALVAPFAAMLVQLGVSRSREYLADRTGAELSQDPEALARALEKLEYAAHHVPARIDPATASLFIVNPLAARMARSLFSTHPPMEERVRRLRMLAGRNPVSSDPNQRGWRNWQTRGI